MSVGPTAPTAQGSDVPSKAFGFGFGFEERELLGGIDGARGTSGARHETKKQKENCLLSASSRHVDKHCLKCVEAKDAGRGHFGETTMAATALKLFPYTEVSVMSNLDMAPASR